MLFLGGGSCGQNISTDGRDYIRRVKPKKLKVLSLCEEIPECESFETEGYYLERIIDGGARLVYRHESITCDEMLELYKNRN